MATTLLLLLLGALALAGVVGTLVLVSRDGYRRLPTRSSNHPTPRAPHRKGGASAGNTSVAPGVSATFAVAARAANP